MSASRWVHLDVVEVRRESIKAFELELEEAEVVWIPKSQIHDPGRLKMGDRNVTVSITEWIANEKGIEIED